MKSIMTPEEAFLETPETQEQLHGHASHSDLGSYEEEEMSLPEEAEVSDETLRRHAAATVKSWEMIIPVAGQGGLAERIDNLQSKLDRILLNARDALIGRELTPTPQLLKSRRLLESILAGAKRDLRHFRRLPHAASGYQGASPRITNLAEAYLSATQGIWSARTFALYIEQTQQHHPLLLDEVLFLPQALNVVALEFIVDRVEEIATPPAYPSGIAVALHSLRRMDQYEWQGLLESLVSFEPILHQDPGGTFAAMDDETRALYRKRVAHLACHSDFDEIETASAAIDMARLAQNAGDSDPRRLKRLQHVGYYLFAEGRPALEHRIGYHPPAPERFRRFVRRYNEDFYVIGIIVVSLLLILPIITPLVPHNDFWLVMGAMLLALLPVTQGAVELINSIVVALLKAEPLPKIDCSKGVPALSTTLVVVPILLLREHQVQEMFEDLEARYLSNEDPNIHFALLTDLPDTSILPQPDDRHPLVQMAIRWTENLNAKYANGKGGAFLLLHRERVFNARQGVWMGWERKRGKLLDLNKFLLHDFDSFPIKAGPLHVLKDVRYVITLDADTKLSYAAAARMIGAISHPLNHAIVNPKLRIVTSGYGILQPRVGVSITSASRSRLAAIYSGETGLDIYTRAVSNVYQDLFGEGIFTGKGIYEVSILHHVLDHRFPRNSLLSHDLIEGAYVCAGLVTDIEIIDDYPSQYDAHTRRKHRWIRGDWQILRWLFSPVPDESGRMVHNPISVISRWKIFDNLRRSLVEPVTFMVLVLGWFVFPGGALYWTAVTIALLLLPGLVQLAFDLCKAVAGLSAVAARRAFVTFLGSIAMALINLTFLPQQTLLSVDAIVRSLTRIHLSGRRLLEWETAAQAEFNTRRSPFDIHLRLSPLIALLFATYLALFHPHSLMGAGPVLFLWLIAPLVVLWLNSAPRADTGELGSADRGFLEQQVLRIWRFYSDFGGSANHFLIPDHVEEKNLHPVRMLTPTNIGMLLNARQAAQEFGLLTLPEFAEATLQSLTSLDRMEKYRGHIYNWYDLESLRPILPVVVSTVDSGNLAASLYTLHAGAIDLLRKPLLSVDSFNAVNNIATGRITSDRAKSASASLNSSETLVPLIRELFGQSSNPVMTLPGAPFDRWASEEAQRRSAALAGFIEVYLPWFLPDFEPLADLIAKAGPEVATLENVADFLRNLSAVLTELAPTSPLHPLAVQLEARIPSALDHLARLQQDFKTISDRADRFVMDMDFSFLLVESRQLLSTGYDFPAQQLQKTCFDLLASESRMAVFLAVAKGDIPQQSWFRLDRSHVLFKGRPALLSWTATIFEYLMPTLWMQAYPDTLLTNALDTVIRVQIDHVNGIPWGISESGFASSDENGRYGYQAWGIPALALKESAEDGPVISPYSTFLALPLARRQALANLRHMVRLSWIGEYGLYEAADYIEAGKRNRQPRLVRSWMAHHQGMSLLALSNVLRDNIFQRWFHAHPRVRAAEQLLHEKPLRREIIDELAKQAA
jgi:cyclic beta-1,2-glucan synthetase